MIAAMTDADVFSLSQRLLWLAFALGLGFGTIARRSHFCTMGAVADIVHMGDWSRMRMWALAAGVAVLGFSAMVAMGSLRAADTVYAAPTLLWLSHAVGGLMFGIGMVLASGCGNRNLVRLGGGNLKSLVVLGVMAVAAFATLKGLTAVWRVATVDSVRLVLPSSQDLPSLTAGLGGTLAQRAAWLGSTVGAALVLLSLWRREPGTLADLLLGGVGIGGLVLALWWVSGHVGHIAEHPQTLEPAFLATNSQRMESFSFVAPQAYLLDWLLFYSDQNKLLTQGIAAVLGVVAGSFVVALLERSFRWEAFGGVEDLANHIVGATLMGVGGVTALGCTIGQGLSGLSTLSLGSFITLAALIAGAVLGLRWQAWRIERQA